jgi:aminoglycoside phosphotransferase family enzyme/predicted kinase
MNEDASEILIKSLQDPALYDHPVRGFTVLETHISWVILTGDYAYKIKKPVRFDFLDFSTLALRRQYCREEVRLNSRYAADLYLQVVEIYGDPRHPSFQGKGEPREYAVKMKQFPQDALLSRLVGRGGLLEKHIDAMAEEIAAFHDRAARADETDPFGRPDRVHQWALENFDEIRSFLHDRTAQTQLEELYVWTEEEYPRRLDRFQDRKRSGGIRECHGDLHLGNMFLEGDRIRLFDCIEFNRELRWIDVMSEAAFVIMDLCDRDEPAFGQRFLNRYLQHTGDYGGLGVLAYYFVYRALVRAKVTLLRLSQGHLNEEESAGIWEAYRGYIDLARGMCRRPAPLLLLTHGVSGSGKSHLAAPMSEYLNAVHVRSDIERKRLYGYGMEARTDSSLKAGIYTPEASARTYSRLEEIAAAVLAGGYPVVIDAAFLKREQRRRFLELGRRLGAETVILDFQAPEAVLRERVLQRQRAGGDPSEAGVDVLEMQLRDQEPLSEEEWRCTLAVDGADPRELAGRLRGMNLQTT